MKKNIIVSILILSLAGFLGSCKSKQIIKQSYSDYTGQGNTGPKTFSKNHEEKDPCEIESLNEPADEYRDYGSAINADRDFARQIAIFNAQVSLTRRIQSEMMAIFKSYKEMTQKDGIVKDEQDIEARAASKAKACLSNLKILCSERYRISDGTYEQVVCVSIPAVQVETAAKAFVTQEVEAEGGKLQEDAYQKSREGKKDFVKLQSERR